MPFYGVLRGCRLHPISSVYAQNGCHRQSGMKTIAEPTLLRSLQLVAYLNLGYIRRLKDSGKNY